MLLLPADLMANLMITRDLALKAGRYTAEELAAADPEDLRLLLACHELLARKIVAYAKVKVGGIKPLEPLFVPRAVVSSQVSVASLQALYDTAVETWLRKGMITAGPLKVTFGGVDLWVKAVSRCFYIDTKDFGQSPAGYRVWGTSSLVTALCTMDGEQRRLPIDGILRALISFAESYSADQP